MSKNHAGMDAVVSPIADIVTNAGSGLLQHSVINAREFGIPSVIGTQVATDVIRSEQIIVIDGAQAEILLDFKPIAK